MFFLTLFFNLWLLQEHIPWFPVVRIHLDGDDIMAFKQNLHAEYFLNFTSARTEELFRDASVDGKSETQNEHTVML